MNADRLARLTAEWSDLKQVYLFAHEQAEAYHYRLKARYGTDLAHVVYATRKERKRVEMLERREQRAYDRIFRWLDKHSLWDWHSGTGAHWICTKLTADKALSDEAPVLPAESAGYGSARVDRRAERRIRQTERQEA